LAFVTFDFFNFWTLQFFFVTTFTWQAFTSFTRIATVNCGLLNGQVFAFSARGNITSALFFFSSHFALIKSESASVFVTADFPFFTDGVLFFSFWINTVSAMGRDSSGACSCSTGDCGWGSRCSGWWSIFTAFNFWTFTFFNNNSGVSCSALIVVTGAFVNWAAFLILTQRLT
jgi:hypothetical protein